MPDLPNESLPLLTRRKSVQFINEVLGIPIKESSFAKKAMKKRKTVPKPDAFYGRQELYSPSTLREWALTELCTDKPAKIGAE